MHEGEKMVANCFSVICPDDKIIVLAAASSDQMNKWLVDLRKAVGDYKCDDVNTSNHLGIPLGQFEFATLIKIIKFLKSCKW